MSSRQPTYYGPVPGNPYTYNTGWCRATKFVYVVLGRNGGRLYGVYPSKRCAQERVGKSRALHIRRQPFYFEGQMDTWMPTAPPEHGYLWQVTVESDGYIQAVRLHAHETPSEDWPSGDHVAYRYILAQTPQEAAQLVTQSYLQRMNGTTT